jgi:hypothetical protein
MSDEGREKGNLISRIRRWIRDEIVQEVPPEMSACEFDCRHLECTQGEWETCKNRLRGMNLPKA